VDRAVSKEPPFGMWDLRFESRFLQRRVCKPSVPQLQRFVGLRQRKQVQTAHLT